MTGPAAASDRAATAVEQPQSDTGVGGCGDQGDLGVVESPVRRQVATVLVRVGVSQHDFLDLATVADVIAVELEGQHLPHHVRTGGQVLDRLEQRDHVDAAADAAIVGGDQPHLLEQDHRLQNVRHR